MISNWRGPVSGGYAARFNATDYTRNPAILRRTDQYLSAVQRKAGALLMREGPECFGVVADRFSPDNSFRWQSALIGKHARREAAQWRGRRLAACSTRACPFILCVLRAVSNKELERCSK